MSWLPLIVGIFLLLGFAVGGVAGWLIARGYTAQESAATVSQNAAEVASARVRVEELLKRISALEVDAQTSQRALEVWRAELTALKQVEARLTSELQSERAAAAQRAHEGAARVGAVEADAAARNQELDTMRADLASVKEERATLAAQLAREREAAAERSAEFSRQMRQVEDALRVRDHELQARRGEVTTLREEHARLSAEIAAERSAATERLARARSDLADLEGALAARAGQLDRAGAEIDALNRDKAQLAAQLEVAHAITADKVALLREAEERLAQTFHAVSSQALRENAESLVELAGASIQQMHQESSRDLDGRHRAIEGLVQPVWESLAKIDATIRSAEEQRAESSAFLGEQLRTLALSQQTLQGETAALASALRPTATQARWGEVQLRRVIEMAGMTEHCDFDARRRAASDEEVLTSDVVIRLPNGRTVVVDAQVPMSAYLAAFENGDELARRAQLQQHANLVRDHIAKLGARAYWEQFPTEPEFVFMFLPGESFLSSAMQHDPSLLEFGVSRGVIPASPLTLISLLRAVAFGWRQDRIAQDAGAIRALGRELQGRIRDMAEQWTEVANALSQTVSAYNRAVGMMEHRVLATTRRLSEHGAVAEPVPHLEPVEYALRSFQAPEVTSGRVTTMRIRHATPDTSRGESASDVSATGSSRP